jgi:predicted aminopeptidase
VTACAADSFTPHLWHFPIVGAVPYKGFFDKAAAERERARLEAEGWDTAMQSVMAYSTLGWFTDPVFSTMLAYDDGELVRLVLHELTHGTVYAPGQGEFNETLASFAGHEAAVQFFLRREGPESPVIRLLRDEEHDEEAFFVFLADLLTRLERIYAESVSREDKLARREPVFREARERFDREVRPGLRTGRLLGFSRVKLNNAELQARFRYRRTPDFVRLYEFCGRDWKRFFTAARRIARLPEPLKALRESLP